MGSARALGQSPLGELAADVVEVPDFDEGIHPRAGQAGALGIEDQVDDAAAVAGEPQQELGTGRPVNRIERDRALLRADRQGAAVGGEAPG